MTGHDLVSLRVAYEAVFASPFESSKWASWRARTHWAELRNHLDSLAIPLDSVVTTGGCGYLYDRDGSDLTGISDPDGLLAVLLGWHDRLAAEVNEFIPRTPAEIADADAMWVLVADIRALVERAVAVERTRFAREGVA